MKITFSLPMIRDLRKQFYLKQYDICRYIKVSDVAYRTWESRVRRPNDEHLASLKKLFLLLDSHAIEVVDRQSALDILDREFVLDGEE